MRVRQLHKHSWIQQLKKLCQQHWIPMLLALVATITVLGLWQQLWRQEQLHLEQLVQQEADALEVELNRELSSQIFALEQMADRWQVSGGTPKALWEADAANLVKHHDGYQAIEWVDPSFHVQWMMPLKGNEMVQNLDLNQEPRRKVTLNVARDLRQTILTRTISLTQGGKGFLACIPLWIDSHEGVEVDRFDGFIVGVFRVQNLFDSILEISPKYRVQIYDSDGLIYSQGEVPPSTQPKTVVVQAYGADWQVQIFPTAVLISAGRSSIPTLVLWGGLAGVWTLAFTVYLGQRSKYHARRASLVNQQLQAEIAERQHAEATLRKSEERLQLALEASGEGWWDWDLTTGQVNRSAQYLELLGYEIGEFPESVDSWKNSIHPDDFSGMIDRLKTHLRDSSAPYACEYRVKTKSGDWQWISDYGKVVVRDAKNKPLRMIGTFKNISDRKASEAALRQSESILRSFFNSGAMLMGIVELHDNDILHLSDNQATASFFDTTPEAMQNRFASDMGVPSAHLQQWIDRYREAAQTQMPVRFEYLHTTPAEQRWLAVSVCQISGNSSPFPRFSYIAEDITERKQIEASLRQSEEKFRQLAENICAVFWMSDPVAGQVLYVSPAYEDIWGYSCESLYQDFSQWIDAIHPDDRGRIMQAQIDDVFQGTYDEEYRIIRPDGSIRWIHDRGFLVKTPHAEMTRIAGIAEDITVRKQAESERQEMSEVLENVVSGIARLNAQGQYLYVNKAYATITGYQPDEMLKITWQQTVHPAELDKMAAAYQQMVQNGRVEIEATGIRKDGSIFYKELVMIAIYGDSQQLTGHYCFMKDISERARLAAERKRAEVALEKELLRSQALFNTSIDGVVVLNRQGDVVQSSFSFARMIGYSIEETLKLNVADWDAQWTRAELQHQLENEITPLFETRHRRKDGSIYDVEVSYSRVEIDGEMMHFCICRDISQRKKAEIALQNSQARLAGILEIASDAIISVNADQQIILFNQGAERIFGYQAQEVLGQPLALIMPDRFAQQHQHHVSQYVQTGHRARQMAQRGAIFGRRKDGTEFPAEASISKLDLNGELTFTTFLRDITERYQAEAALRQSEEKFRMAIDFTYDWEYWQAPDGSFVYISPSSERITGYSPDEFLKNPDLIHTLVHPDDLDVLNNHVCARHSGVGFADYRIITRSGETRWISHTCQPIFSSDGQYVGKRASNRDISDRKRVEEERQQAEQALRESEARFQAFMNHSPAAAWITDANGKVLYLSQTYLRTFQIPTQNPTGQSIFDLFPEEVARPLWQNIQTVARTQQVLEAIEIAPRRDGTMGDFWVYKFPVPDSSGQTLVGGVAIDVTLQHQAEEALRRSEATKQAIIQAIPDLLIRMRSDGGYLEFISNSKFNIAKPEQQRDGTSVYDILPSQLAQLRMQYAQQALESGVAQVYEHEILIEGKRSYEEVRIVPLLRDEVLVMVRDVTEQQAALRESKQAEEEIRHQKEMFQAIVNHIPVMIALFNAKGRIEFINPELEQLLGWSIEDWRQRNILADCYPDPIYRQSVLDHMLAATGNWRDLTTLNAAGQQLETSWANVRLSNGLLLGIGQDISERKRKEVALRQAMEAAEAANLAKSTFLANMSHELRTPLNVILGFTQVMTHDTSLTASQREDLQTIRRSGDHLLSLINDVLDLSKIEAGHYTLEESGFDLISLLHTLRTMMTERAKAKRLQLEFDIAPTVPQFVVADEQKLRQVLLNLLSNAIKFTNQGTVVLRVNVPEGEPESEPERDLLSLRHSILLQFEVTDTGVGIATQEQETIFDAFVQAEAGKKLVSGTGLGLTISRKLIELMHGQISVQSMPDVGSTFTFTIPVCPTSGVDVQSEQTDCLVIGLAPGQPRYRILVVDDQRENRLLLVRLLTQLGLEVREAKNGQDAIQLWREWQPDLTWMDIRMPGLDGYEATKWIREFEKASRGDAMMSASDDGPSLPVCSPSLSAASRCPSIIIALTAQASQSDRALALAAGCNDYISKPFREETLFLKLKEHLGLEYLYAKSRNLPDPSSATSPKPEQASSIDLDPSMFATLPADWLHCIENAATCGNDGAIADLAAQLPPEFATLGVQLTELAERFQFEEILELVHHQASD